MARSDAVDRYIEGAPAYARPILIRLRELIHGADPKIEEAMKWNAASFEHSGIVCTVHAFRNYVAIWFPKGALLEDPKGLLKPGRKARVMKVIHLRDVAELDEDGFRELIRQAVALNVRRVRPPRRTDRGPLPPELRAVLEAEAELKAVFDSLAPGLKGELCESISEAKRADTIRRRVSEVIAELERRRRKGREK